MKKKLLVMSLALSVMLAACGGDANTEETGANTPDTVSEETETNETGAETEAETDETNNDAAGEGEAAEATEAEYARGITTETGYESEWIGIRYTAPEGQTMRTDEELNEIMGLGAEVLADDYTEAQLEYAAMSTVYEMMSSNETGSTNLIATVEKLPVSGYTSEDYMAALVQGLEGVSAMNFTINSSDEVVTIAGAEYLRANISVETDGYTISQDYYVRVIGDRAVSFALTYSEPAEAEAIMNAFTAY